MDPLLHRVATKNRKYNIRLQILVLIGLIVTRKFPSRCFSNRGSWKLPAREHGYLRSGHVTEATSPVDVLTILRFHWKVLQVRWS